jgi:hypothetical protein
MHVYKYQMVLEPAFDLPELFFKDEGGRNNCMEIRYNS